MKHVASWTYCGRGSGAGRARDDARAGALLLDPTSGRYFGRRELLLQLTNSSFIYFLVCYRNLIFGVLRQIGIIGGRVLDSANHPRSLNPNAMLRSSTRAA